MLDNECYPILPMMNTNEGFDENEEWYDVKDERERAGSIS